MQHKCTADNNFVNESRNHSPPPLLRKPSPLETYFKVGLVFVKVLGMALFNEGRGGAEMGEESNPQDYRDVISAPRQVF